MVVSKSAFGLLVQGACATTALAAILLVAPGTRALAQGESLDLAPVDVVTRRQQPSRARPTPPRPVAARATPRPRPVRAAVRGPVAAPVVAAAPTLPSAAAGGGQGGPGLPSGTNPGGARGPVPGFVASRSVVASKTDTPIIETAQSVSVIGRQQIEDQNALSINQALRYTPSVTTEQRGAAGSTRLEQFNIRGFAAPIFVDGLRLPTSRDAFPSVDPYRIDRIDVVKGPASVLYGQAGPGGLVNLVSKVPQFFRHNEVFVQGGGFGEVRGGFDVGGPVPAGVPGAEEFAYRLVGFGWDGDQQAVTTRVQRALIAPSVTWRPSADTTLTLLGLYERDPQSGFYGGFPAVGTVFRRDFGNGNVGYLSPRFYDGDRNFERSDRTQASATYLFDHRFNDQVRFHSAGRYLATAGVYRSVFSAFTLDTGPFAAGPTISRSRGGTNVEIDSFQIDNYLEFKFDTGILGHTVLFGSDHYNAQTRTFAGPFPAAPALNVLAPNYEMNIPFPAFTSFQKLNQEQTGIYLQDQVRFDRFVLTLGGRYDEALQYGPTRTLATGAVARQEVPSEALTGRASLLYLFDSGIAPYVSYSEAFEPLAGGRIFDASLGATGRLPDPIASRQYEAGIKYQPPGTDILLTAAAFDIRRTGTLSTDPANPGFSLQTGEIGVQGIEFEAKANLAEGWNVVGGFSFLDLRNTRDSNFATNARTGQRVSLAGLRPVNIPDSTASLFVEHTVQGGPLVGLTLGGGVRYLGQSWGDPANTFKVPESVLLDALVRYDLKHLDPKLAGLDLRLNANNLLDERYVTGCFEYSTCFYGASRTVYATLRYRW